MPRRLTFIVWFLGVLALLAMVLHQGAGTVLQAVATAGWGLLLVTAFHFIPMVADTLAWRQLLPISTRPHLGRLLWMRWIGESVNSLLPAAQIGGDLLRGRLAAQRGVPQAEAAASIVVDLTLSVLTLTLCSMLGVLLAMRRGESAFVPLLGGLLFASGGCVLAVRLQRRGMFQAITRVLGRLVNHRVWDRVAGSAAALDGAITNVYTRTSSIGQSLFWQLLAWLLGAGEIWLALRIIDHPIGLLDAVMIECLIQAVRGAAFPVPGAIGVQEGGMILLGMFAGVPAELALAVSLIKRVRELALGVPGLIAWQIAEGKHWLHHHR